MVVQASHTRDLGSPRPGFLFASGLALNPKFYLARFLLFTFEFKRDKA